MDMHLQHAPFVGIEVDNALAEGRPLALMVKRVITGSPAMKAGFAVGDALVNIGRTPVPTRTSLIETLSNYKPGETITVKIMRQGKTQRLKLTLGERQMAALRFRPVETPVGA
jgi:S1-C subfamily serine protease